MCIGSVDNSSKFATTNTFYCNWVLNVQFADLSGDKLLTFQPTLVWASLGELKCVVCAKNDMIDSADYFENLNQKIIRGYKVGQK